MFDFNKVKRVILYIFRNPIAKLINKGVKIVNRWLQQSESKIWIRTNIV